MRPVRDWTIAEIFATVADVKAARPGLWEELQRLELAGEDLGNAGRTLHLLLRARYPDATPDDRAILMILVRALVRRDVGLWPPPPGPDDL